MTQEYTRDGIGKLAGATAMLSGGGTLRGMSYQFDALDRRSRADWSDGTFWSYGYNERGEVTSGHKQFAAGAFVGGSQ